MISLIAAVSKNNVIGNNGEIPWHLPNDSKHFASITKGHTVVMGRKTYESIITHLGKPLPERKNIIITRDTSYQVPGATVVHSVEEAIKECANEKEAFVIGGGEILKLAIPYLNRMYLTHVEAEVPADSFFPEFNPKEWEVVSEKFHPKDEKHPYNFTFKVYEKI